MKTPGGMFNGADFANAGRGALPGSGWLNRAPVPPPPGPPVPKAPAISPPKPPTKSTYGQGGMDPTTAQGFGTWASMFKPITEGVLGVGGMPALMGIYGMVSGNKDWRTATTKQAIRLPLPVGIADGLGMPDLTKFAQGPASTLTWGQAAKAKPLPVTWGQGSRMAEPMSVAKTELDAPKVTVRDDGIDWKDTAKRTAVNSGIRVGSNMAMTRAANRVPSMAKLLTKSPGKGGLLFDTPVNMATDAIDAAGIYSVDGTKPHSVWQKPKFDADNQPVVRSDGTQDWDYGWNRDALGWDMKAHDTATTPDDTIAFGLNTGITPFDNWASKRTSSINAYNSPLKSLWSLGKFVGYDMMPWNDTTKDWKQLARKGGVRDTNEKSIPLIMQNNYAAAKPWQPNKNQYYAGEKGRYVQRDEYHPSYNRAGTKNRPWAGERWWDALWNQ